MDKKRTKLLLSSFLAVTNNLDASLIFENKLLFSDINLLLLKSFSPE
jgi:hypothetical protein